ncbi:gp073R [Rabbit fibroma virus]|uniref:Gp073R n=1 Tax=Rabbit fibroma virus (strain Kasza) TaxID=10272 RepID=Q9Q8Z9_RFVKA|nr:late transcription factor VLTF-4 [Rabbit fibroma virus]AAF17955.1 gp073R [Rabbit fibroma virus]
MSWSINLGSGSGDNFKTLDEIRAHVKSTTETAIADDIFPEDIKIPSPKQSKTKRITTPRKKPVPKTSKKKEEELLPPPYKEEVKESEEEEEEEAVVEESPKSHQESTSNTQNTTPMTDTRDTMDTSDLKLVTEQIIKEMKALNAKVSAVSTILETIQAASVGRQYTMLTKNIEELRMLVVCGKEQVVRKKTRHTTTKK